MKDVFGQAILDYAETGAAENLMTWTSISEPDPLPISYLFRSFVDMPKIEQYALQLSYGKVLDVGCGAGSHSAYLSEVRKLHVTPIDMSEAAIRACKLRGLLTATSIDVFKFYETGFDTILLLMNGTGIAGTIRRLQVLLQHLKTLISRNGQILVDSSDIRYMFDDDEQAMLENRVPYYGELQYYLSYKGVAEQPMQWLYTDYDTLSAIAESAGLQAEKIMEGAHFDYLARLTNKTLE